MARRKPSYPQDTNHSNGIAMPYEPVKLTGNVGFPDPLLLLRQATANSGAVSSNGIQASGSYDLSLLGTIVRKVFVGTNSVSGFYYNGEGMHYYRGANRLDLRSQGELTLMVRIHPKYSSSITTGLILAFRGESGGSRPGSNIQYYLQKEEYTGNYRFVQQSGAGTTSGHTFAYSTKDGSVPHTVGIRRAANGVDIELIINGIVVESATLAAAPDGGDDAFLHVGGLYQTGPSVINAVYADMSGIYLVKAALTDAQLLNLHNSMMV